MSEPRSNPSLDEALLDAHWLKRFARSLAECEHEAQDVAQDALSAALGSSLSASLAPATFRAQLVGIARNIAKNRRRRDQRRSEREHRAFVESSQQAAPVDEDVARLELLQIVLGEMGKLPPAQRRALTMRFVDGLEPRAIAEKNGTSPATVRAHIARGLSTLRERLDRGDSSRGEWRAILAPWALDAPLLAPIHGPVHAAAGAQVATTLLSTGLAALIMKFAIAALATLLLTGLWYASRPDETTAQFTRDGEVSRAEEDALRGDTSETGRLPGPAAAASAPAATEQEAPPEQINAALAQGVSWNGKLVDVLTGEAVPHMNVSVAQVVDGEGEERFHFTSDEAGTLMIGGTHFMAGTLRLRQGSEGCSLGTTTQPIEISYPFQESIPVHVGPSFIFEWPDGPAPEPHRCTFRFGAEFSGQFEGITASMVWGKAEGPPPSVWARFPTITTELFGDPPYRVVVEDKSGLWRASAEVMTKVGIDPAPIKLAFESNGAIKFTLPSGGTRTSFGGINVKVERIDGQPEEMQAVPRRAYLNEHLADGTANGTVGSLSPGTYRWHFGNGASAALGEATVAAGKVTLVELSPDMLGEGFDTYVLVDASAHPSAQVDNWLTLLVSKEGTSLGTMLNAKRHEEDPPHHWRIELDGLGEGAWEVSLQPEAAIRVDPNPATVLVGAPPQVMRLLPDPPRTRLALRVVDDITGSPILDAEAGYFVLPSDRERCQREEDGLLVTDRAFAKGETPMIVRAPGYCTEWVSIAAASVEANDEGSGFVTVRLRPGWSNRVTAVDLVGLRPVPGMNVLVDGQPSGVTDSGGSVFLRGEAPPKRLALDGKSVGYNVMQSPHDIPTPEGESDDPLWGFVFIVARM